MFVLLLYAVLPALVVYVAALGLSAAAGIKSALVIRDLAQTADYPLGVGLISSLGYLLWMAAASIALFAGFSFARGRLRALLLSGGFFSLLLCLDDMFLLHDRYISANVLYLAYAVFAILILSRFRDLVLSSGGLAFLVSVLLLGGSMLIDQLQSLYRGYYNQVQLFEEGFKFIGIACWLLFWCQASAKAATPRITP
ncbi:MAG: oxidoreductase [Prochlorococcaceae cyanobacterium]